MEMDGPSLLAELSARVHQRSPEPLTVSGRPIHASGALRLCTAAQLCAAASARPADAAAQSGKNSGWECPQVEILAKMPPPGKDLGVALQQIAEADRAEQQGAGRRRRAAPCPSIAPRCPVTGELMQWPLSTKKCFKAAWRAIPPLPPSPPGTPQPPPSPPQGPGEPAGIAAERAQRSLQAAATGALAAASCAAAAPPPAKPQLAGWKGKGKGGAHPVPIFFSHDPYMQGMPQGMSQGLHLHSKPSSSGAPSGPQQAADAKPLPFAVPTDLGPAIKAAMDRARHARRYESLWRCYECKAGSSHSHGPWRWYSPRASLCALCWPPPPGATDLCIGARVRLKRRTHLGIGASPGDCGVVKRVSQPHVFWVAFLGASGVVHCTRDDLEVYSEQRFPCDGEPADAQDAAGSAAGKAAGKGSEMGPQPAAQGGPLHEVALGPKGAAGPQTHVALKGFPPGLKGVGRGGKGIHPSPLHWLPGHPGYPPPEMTTPQLGSSFGPGPPPGAAALAGLSGSSASAVGGKYTQPKVLQYEAMDSAMEWWPCTVERRNPDKTLLVRVNDGAPGGTVWASAYSHLVRAKSVRTSGAWEKGTGYVMGDEMDERDQLQAARAARYRKEQQAVSDQALCRALRAASSILRHWPRTQAADGTAEMDLPLYPHYAALTHGPLPAVMERLLVNDSLHEITERSELYHHLLELVSIYAGDRALCESLLFSTAGAGGQRNPVRLLRSIAEQAKVFLHDSAAVERALAQDADDQGGEIAAVSMAMSLQDVMEQLQSALGPAGNAPSAAAAAGDGPAGEAEQEDPFDGMRFEMVDLLQGATLYPHHFKNDIQSSAKQAPTAQGKRMRQMAALATGLPDGIFVRVDEARQDVIKAMIIGPEGTPYQNGCFVFDIWLPPGYPNEPPKVYMVTTHNQQVRFNPNLYADGKVCLSLLGTWEGPGWDPKVSTLLQVLLSIQSMIMVPDPYYNEPGFEADAQTPGGRQRAQRYCESVRLFTCKVAILDQLRDPHPDFADCIRKHFAVRQAAVRQQIESWLPAADSAAGNPSHPGMGFLPGPYGVGGSREFAQRNFNPATVRRRALLALGGRMEPDDCAAAAAAAPGLPAAAGQPPPSPGWTPFDGYDTDDGDLAIGWHGNVLGAAEAALEDWHLMEQELAVTFPELDAAVYPSAPSTPPLPPQPQMFSSAAHPPYVPPSPYHGLDPVIANAMAAMASYDEACAGLSPGLMGKVGGTYKGGYKGDPGAGGASGKGDALASKGGSYGPYMDDAGAKGGWYNVGYSAADDMGQKGGHKGAYGAADETGAKGGGVYSATDHLGAKGGPKGGSMMDDWGAKGAYKGGYGAYTVHQTPAECASSYWKGKGPMGGYTAETGAGYKGDGAGYKGDGAGYKGDGAKGAPHKGAGKGYAYGFDYGKGALGAKGMWHADSWQMDKGGQGFPAKGDKGTVKGGYKGFSDGKGWAPPDWDPQAPDPYYGPYSGKGKGGKGWGKGPSG